MTTEIVPMTLDNGTTISIEATLLGGEEDVALTTFSFQEVTHALEAIAASLTKSLSRIKPQRASVELGVSFGIESGVLTAILVKGTGTANLKITLEWGEQASQEAGNA